ncbi:hypothetical protein QTP81_13610 [Alteromonas sp. ASW11-36]|uniref:Nuclear transport factor 2 family protein n=1 Tax=Alteromonas arenosi TaxID=3055817 RepID=A0ABT7T1G0_9ALTE|nr:hypothetical protein [Alteromonas sp. ASW11-36]MDM7861632.1 hypothetical protein [Alteromonas sp. ASW11-36]
MRLVYFFLVLIIFSPALVAKNNNLTLIVEEYIDVYSARVEFIRFMDFYHEDVTFEDKVCSVKLQSKTSLKSFFDWHRGDFVVLDGSQALKVDNLSVIENSAIITGEFSKFTFDGQVLGPWDFLLYLEFNDNGKIIKQTDWINYRPFSFLTEMCVE